MQEFILSEMLKSKGITQKELCLLIDIKPEVLSRNLKKNKKGISLELLLKIGDALDIDVRSFFSSKIPNIEDFNIILENERVGFNRLKNVVPEPLSLLPSDTSEYSHLKKFGLYPAEHCVPFITKKGTPFYYLDNMAVMSGSMNYGAYTFKQLEILFNLPRIDNCDAQIWLMDNLFQSRMDEILPVFEV